MHVVDLPLPATVTNLAAFSANNHISFGVLILLCFGSGGFIRHMRLFLRHILVLYFALLF